MRNYLRRVLGDHYLVHTVSDGSAVLIAVENSAPQLIITDVMMPNIDVFELTQRLRAYSATAMIPIIMLFARAGVEAAVDGLGAGADDLNHPSVYGDSGVSRDLRRLSFLDSGV